VHDIGPWSNPAGVIARRRPVDGPFRCGLPERSRAADVTRAGQLNARMKRARVQRDCRAPGIVRHELGGPIERRLEQPVRAQSTPSRPKRRMSVGSGAARAISLEHGNQGPNGARGIPDRGPRREQAASAATPTSHLDCRRRSTSKLLDLGRMPSGKRPRGGEAAGSADLARSAPIALNGSLPTTVPAIVLPTAASARNSLRPPGESSERRAGCW
jgi:hypothetical protein